MTVFDFLERFDLVPYYYAAAVIGGLLAVYVGLKAGQDRESQQDCIFVRTARLYSYPALALVLFSLVLFSHEKGWQPWPPDLALVIVVDVILIGRAVSLLKRKQKEQRATQDLIGSPS